MTLNGKIYVESRLIKETEITITDEKMSFKDKLEKCLLDLCSEFQIPVPLWLKKNTKEFAVFRRTFFTPEQFVEKVWFDKFEIMLT